MITFQDIISLSQIQQHSTLLIMFAIIGVIWVIYYVILFIWHLIKLCLSQPDIIQSYGKNTWAVVTGSTSTIGQEFCKQLIAKGFNVVLIGRNEVQLEQLKNEIIQLDDTAQLRIVKADFTKSTRPGFYRRIQKQLLDIDISILVNNAGTITAGPFINMTEDQINEMILINCMPIMHLTRRLLHKMILRKKRSAIINVTAAIAEFPCPFNSVFGAVKSFQDYFSRSLNNEFERKKIDVLTLRPTLVTSNMNKNQDKYGAISAEEFVKGGLEELGKSKESYCNWSQGFQNWLNSILPDRIRYRINYDYHKQNIFRYNYAEDNDKDDESLIGEDDDDDEQQNIQFTSKISKIANNVSSQVSKYTSKIMKK